jgi:hypothetical protein
MTRKEMRSMEREWTLVPMHGAPAAQISPRYSRESPWQSHMRKRNAPRTWRNLWGMLA